VMSLGYPAGNSLPLIDRIRWAASLGLDGVPRKVVCGRKNMIKCERCGTKWEDWAPEHWDSAMVARFGEGRGCPDCASLDDAEAVKRLEASLRRDVEQTPGVSSVLRGLGVLDVIGGVLLFVVSLGQKNPYGCVNLVAAFAWLLAGITSGALMIGAAEVVRSLHLIGRAVSASAALAEAASVSKADKPSV